jgi:hypothetical protein
MKSITITRLKELYEGKLFANMIALSNEVEIGLDKAKGFLKCNTFDDAVKYVKELSVEVTE